MSEHTTDLHDLKVGLYDLVYEVLDHAELLDYADDKIRVAAKVTNAVLGTLLPPTVTLTSEDELDAAVWRPSDLLDEAVHRDLRGGAR